jgi:hypothetical protein
MSESAIRKSDKTEIKIGTCDNMYYLRYEDRNNVTPLSGNVNPAKDKGLRFRLPFPDEDHVAIGEYEDHTRGYRLSKQTVIKGEYSEYTAWVGFEFPDSEAVQPGIIQLSHTSGLLINVPCHHGKKLPDVAGGEIKAFWNGKDNHQIELKFVKACEDGVMRPVIGCKYCREMWLVDWADIRDYVQAEMLDRLDAIFGVPTTTTATINDVLAKMIEADFDYEAIENMIIFYQDIAPHLAQFIMDYMANIEYVKLPAQILRCINKEKVKRLAYVLECLGKKNEAESLLWKSGITE